MCQINSRIKVTARWLGGYRVYEVVSGSIAISYFGLRRRPAEGESVKADTPMPFHAFCSKADVNRALKDFTSSRPLEIWRVTLTSNLKRGTWQARRSVKTVTGNKMRVEKLAATRAEGGFTIPIQWI